MYLHPVGEMPGNLGRFVAGIVTVQNGIVAPEPVVRRRNAIIVSREGARACRISRARNVTAIEFQTRANGLA